MRVQRPRLAHPNHTSLARLAHTVCQTVENALSVEVGILRNSISLQSLHIYTMLGPSTPISW